MNAKYKCIDEKCGNTWQIDQRKNTGMCPKCRNKYYIWLNYNKFSRIK